MHNINITFEDIHYWTDSQIVLSWIKGDPACLKTFVANRVGAIQELTQGKQWRYVNTKENPADLVSRGIFPEQLKASKLWFNGPEFLKTSKSRWPQQMNEKVRLQEEEKQVKVTLTTTRSNEQHPLYLINHRNSFRRLNRIMAYILRSLKAFKNKGKNEQCTSFLTVRELEDALSLILKEIQSSNFQEDIRNLHIQNQVSKTSKLKALAPFIDPQGLLRVGGRLEAANIGYDAKHPILLPADNFVTKLLMHHLHNLHLHAGPQALHAIVRQKYWILQGRNIARSVVANCIRCTKVRPKLCNQLMGDLPQNRVQRARPFINCGVDFCGPVYTHFQIRGKRPQKTYIAVFCCFATKAIHLEVVSNLATEGFLGALRRFIARRGKCENIYSDNGGNFVGAHNQLQEINNILTNSNSKERIVNMCLDQKIQFHFIPPRSPHFGGLWEAAVKSTKYLLQRSVASASLTYEELCTTTAEIEAILNSRPLTPLSTDPNDLMALTPAHFLIGEPMTSTVDTANNQGKMSLLSRWALVNHIRHDFWRRWSLEYLGELQKRVKWTDTHPNIQPGMLVVIKDENLPPLKWSLGRILEAISGPDGRVRVADVKTATGIFRRTIHQLAPLPVDLNEDTENPAQKEKMETDDNQEQQQIQQPNLAEGDAEETPRKRRRTKQASRTVNALKVLLMTTLVWPVLSTLAISVTSQVEIRELDSSAGIYFENMGTSSLTSSNWNLLVYYDLKGYWASITIIQQTLKHLEKLYRIINHNEYYAEITNQYYHQLEEINRNNILLRVQGNTLTKPREKRSPLDIVGTVANKLFGVLDNDYAIKMTETIDKIKNNEDHLHDLIKNQTSVLETTVNVIKRSEEERVNQTRKIEEALDVAYEKMRNMSTESKQQKTIQTFNTLSILIASLVNECRFMQEAILDVIADTHHGRSNFLVISPEQLQRQLSIIKENLPPGIQLPVVDGQINVPLIYKLMTIQCQIQNEHIVFGLQIPLVRSTKFELYRLIPFPTLLNDTFVSIASTTDMLMTNLYRDQFYLMTKFEFMQCVKIIEGHHLCQQHWPIRYKSPKINTCEIELFSHHTLPATCDLKIARPGRIWIQLYSSNQWLFSLDKGYNPTFVCGNNIIHKTLQGNGILSMKNGCTMKDDELFIETFNDIQTQFTQDSFQPVFNITFDDLNNITNNAIPTFAHVELISHKKELANLNQELDNIKSHQTNLRELQPHDIHQFTVGYTTIGVISVIIVYLTLMHIRNNRTVIFKKPPVPAPRTRTKDQDYRFEVADFKEAQDV